MLPFPRCGLSFLVTMTLIGAALPALAKGPVLLTVAGKVAEPNRGPVNPDIDKLLVFNEVTFDRAAEFDLDALDALPRSTIRTDFPMGGPMVEFSGPLLADVLAAAGAEGQIVKIQAMDGYAVEVPTREILDNGAMVALSRDGQPLGIGGLGPAQIVFPRADRPELREMPDDWWIWQIYLISVE